MERLSMGRRGRLLAVARGERPADLLLKGGRIVDVASCEVRAANVAVAEGRVAAVDLVERDAEEVVDVSGRFLAPGLVDAHVHVESAMLPPSELGRILLAHGVTTIVTDPHEIANVAGVDGVRFMLEDARRTPLEVFVNLPSCVPATPLSTGGATLGPDELRLLAREPEVLGLAEVMNFPGVVAGDPEVLAKIELFRDRAVDGHCPGLSGPALQAYAAAGIGSDHESVTAEEAREKLRAGLRIFLREATNARNLDALLPLVTRENQDRFCFCTDDRTVPDLVNGGSVDLMVRRAIAGGLEPPLAFRLATLNPAEHYGLRDRGLLAPGRRADLFVFDDLGEPRADAVWAGGLAVAREGTCRVEHQPVEGGPRDTVRLAVENLDFRIAASAGGDGRIRAIGVVPDELLTEARVVAARRVGDELVADPDLDLAEIVVVDRHRRSGRTGRGFVVGFGLRSGAIAGTVAHDHHNLIVVGMDDRSMRTAAAAVVEAGGGLAVAEGEGVEAVLPLPLAGLVSDRPFPEVQRALERLLAAAAARGCCLEDPFMAMSFLGLEVIPELKITDRGLVDVGRMELVPLAAD